MPDPSKNSTSAAPFELPWGLRAAAVLGIAVPVGMLAHLGFEEREQLGETVVDLEEVQAHLAERNEVLTSERDAFAVVVGEFKGVRANLARTNEQLAGERSKRVELESNLQQLNSKVAVLGEREEALRGIIDLLEGEVTSAERRLAKLAESRPEPTLELSHLTASAIVASNDPQLRLENDRLRNELNKHDDQVVELLGEISVLNQEIEMMRDERSRIGSQVGEISEQAKRQEVEIGNGFEGAALAGLADEE